MEGNHIEGKLNKFTTLVLTDAHEKRDKIMENVERQYSTKIDERETELLEDAYEDIQHTIRTMRKDAGEKVLHTELEARKKLILKRDEIIEAVMNAAKEKLDDYRKSADYEEWVLDKIRKAFSELGEGEKTVYISSEDVKIKDKIERLAENVTIEPLKERGVSGGVKVVNNEKHIAVDYTFEELLAEQKRNFLPSSGLTLG